MAHLFCSVTKMMSIRENEHVSYKKEPGNDDTQWEGKKDTF